MTISTFRTRKDGCPAVSRFHAGDAVIDYYRDPLSIEKKLNAVHTNVRVILNTEILEKHIAVTERACRNGRQVITVLHIR
jgi:hypothetical protein